MTEREILRASARARLGPSPEDIRAIRREAELADVEMAAVRADVPAGRCTFERFVAALDRCHRANAAERAIAWLDPAAAADLRVAYRLLDESVSATLARRAGDPGDPELRVVERAARARWMAAASVADRAAACAVTRAARAALARCADAAPRRLPRSRSQRRNRSGSSRPAAKATADPDGPAEPDGRRRHLSSEVAS